MIDIANPTDSVPKRGPNSGGKRRIVVVLGMHRSGTSLLTNLLNVLGVELGEDLLAGNDFNEMGHWENESIYRAQDALMNHVAREWGGMGFVYPFAIDWERQAEFQPFREQLVSIVRSELAKSKRIWGFKDPRTCRLLPMWKQIFAELELEPLYVLAIRNPADVAESLSKRNQLDPLHSELVWLLHNLEAIRDAGEELRIVVDYDRWFVAPHEQARAVAKALELDWPADDGDLNNQLAETIRADLRHSQTRRSCSLPFVAKTYEALQRVAETGAILDKSALDEFGRARECLDAALELSAGAGKIALAVGQAEQSAGNFEAALAAFARATRLQPKLVAAHASTGLAFLSLQRWSEASQSANQALVLDPTDLVALKVLAKSEFQLGQLEAAEQTCMRILEKDADDANALQMVAAMRRQKEEAKRAADKLFGFGAPRVSSVPTIVPAPRFRPPRVNCGITGVVATSPSKVIPALASRNSGGQPSPPSPEELGTLRTMSANAA